MPSAAPVQGFSRVANISQTHTVWQTHPAWQSRQRRQSTPPPRIPLQSPAPPRRQAAHPPPPWNPPSLGPAPARGSHGFIRRPRLHLVVGALALLALAALERVGGGLLGGAGRGVKELLLPDPGAWQEGGGVMVKVVGSRRAPSHGTWGAAGRGWGYGGSGGESNGSFSRILGCGAMEGAAGCGWRWWGAAASGLPPQGSWSWGGVGRQCMHAGMLAVEESNKASKGLVQVEVGGKQGCGGGLRLRSIGGVLTQQHGQEVLATGMAAFLLHP